jgi:hypothetical protein
VTYDNNEKRSDSIYSKRVRAGKRRTYFFDVRSTRGNDYYLTITESRKRFSGEGYDRHKIFLYKEDFNKFIKGLNEAVDYVKTELMPDFDFDAFNHEDEFSSGEIKISGSFPSDIQIRYSLYNSFFSSIGNDTVSVLLIFLIIKPE